MCGNPEASLDDLYENPCPYSIFSMFGPILFRIYKRIKSLCHICQCHSKPSVKSLSQPYFFFPWAHLHYSTRTCWIRDVK